MSLFPNRTSRRTFLKGMAATAGSLYLPNILVADDAPAGKKVGVACIGVGGKGFSDMEAVAKGNELIALCDVDSGNLAKAAAKFPGAKQYTDFRKMLDENKDIEAVTITTPDHAHYPAAMHAMALGKHVYIQKPLCNTLWEAREMERTAQKKGLITQMGNQGHTYEENRILKEWLAAGAIGKPREAHVWTNRPIWPQGKEIQLKEGVNAPESLDWNLWLATAPDRPYSPDIHPFKWRGFIEYGAGALGDMGCHNMDATFWSLDLGLPQKIEAESEELTDAVWPRGAKVKYTWTNTKATGADFVMYWYEGKNADGSQRKPEKPKEIGEKKLGDTGFLIYGSDGVIVNEGDQASKKMAIFPEERATAFLATPPAKTAQRSPTPGNPQQEFIQAIRNGKNFESQSAFHYSIPLTELCLLGALAMRVGKTIEWDPVAFAVKGMPEAQKFIKRPSYRKGWEYSSDKV